MILAGDVGGTKILLEAGEFTSGRWKAILARRYMLAEFASMELVLDAFMEEWKRVRPPRARLTCGAIGVAGPCLGNCVTMTNRPWRLHGDKLAAHVGLPSLRLMNDLEAAAHALDALPPRDFITYQSGKAAHGGNRVLLGVGTGLGVAYIVKTNSETTTGARYGTGTWDRSGTGAGDRSGTGAGDKSGPRARRAGATIVAGEGGHVGFSPATPQQVELWKELARTHSRVEAEHVICGSALERDGMELFSANLGNVAGDHALNVLATGGVFLCGGVIARIGPSIKKDAFSAAFAAKGALASILMRVPVRAIVNEKIALIGAARAACS